MGAKEFKAEVTVCSPYGLHGRPASVIVNMVVGTGVSVRLSAIDNPALVADCDSILSVMMLAAPSGTRLSLHATGDAAEEVGAKLVKYFAEGFGE